MSVQKMFVVASDYLDALRRKAELTDNPVLTAQVSLDKQREEMLQSKGSNAESKDALYTDIIHTQNLFNEQLKKTSKDANTAVPSNVVIPGEHVKKVMPVEEVKKPRFVVTRKLRKKLKQNNFVAPKAKFDLEENFYAYEPEGKTITDLTNSLQSIRPKRVRKPVNRFDPS